MTGLDSQGRVPSMKDFLPETWNTLNREDRLLRLQYAEDMAAQRDGRYPRTISAQKMDGLFGLFDPKIPDTIFINEDFLNPDADAEKYNPYEALLTMYHEGRHSYQHGCAFLKEKNEEDALTVELWKINNVKYHKAQGFRGRTFYRFQPIEEDAENFALEKMKNLAPVFGNDPNYHKFIRKCETDAKFDELIAVLEHGEDFREQILTDIKIRYEYGSPILAKSSIAFHPPKKEAEVTKRRFSPWHLAMTGVTVLLLVIMYFLSHPSGFLRTALWIISASLAFVPTVLLLRKKILSKLFVSKIGGILLTILSWGVLVLLPLIYKLMFMVYVIGGILFLLYAFNVISPRMLIIEKRNADGTVDTESRVLGEDTADAEIAAAKTELRNQGYEIDE